MLFPWYDVFRRFFHYKFAMQSCMWLVMFLPWCHICTICFNASLPCLSHVWLNIFCLPCYHICCSLFNAKLRCIMYVIAYRWHSLFYLVLGIFAMSLYDVFYYILACQSCFFIWEGGGRGWHILRRIVLIFLFRRNDDDDDFMPVWSNCWRYVLEAIMWWWYFPMYSWDFSIFFGHHQWYVWISMWLVCETICCIMVVLISLGYKVMRTLTDGVVH